MKKSALKFFAIAALLAAPAMGAQSLGVHAGINIASASTSLGGASVSVSSTKFLGGVFHDFSFDDMFGIQSELLYRPVGGADFLAVPIQFKVAFTAGPVKPFLLLGPEVSFKIGGAGLKTVDFLAVGGGGVAYDVAPNVAIHVLGRYELGFTDVNSPALPGGATTKIRGIHILAGASFKL